MRHKLGVQRQQRAWAGRLAGPQRLKSARRKRQAGRLQARPTELSGEDRYPDTCFYGVPGGVHAATAGLLCVMLLHGQRKGLMARACGPSAPGDLVKTCAWGRARHKRSSSRSLKDRLTEAFAARLLNGRVSRRWDKATARRSCLVAGVRACSGGASKRAPNAAQLSHRQEIVQRKCSRVQRSSLHQRHLAQRAERGPAFGKWTACDTISSF